MDLTQPDKAALVPDNPFGVEAPPPTKTKANYAPAAQEVSLRVDKVGRDILAANNQLGLKPLFATIGAPQPEIFHVETRLVYVTEGLVRQCRSNADLAAVLSLELGKMIAEREARTSPTVRRPEQKMPIQLPVGSGVQGREADLTSVAELARFEKTNPKASPTLPRPEPKVLARSILEKAGYQGADLDGVQPLLDAAEKNITFERQVKGVLPQSPWAP